MNKNARIIFLILVIFSAVAAGFVSYYKLLNTHFKSVDKDQSSNMPVQQASTQASIPQLKSGYTRFINPKYGFGFDYPEFEKLTVDSNSYTGMHFISKGLSILLMEDFYTQDPKRSFQQTLLDADLGCTLDSVTGSISCDPDKFSLIKVKLKSGVEAYRIDRVKIYEGAGFPDNFKPGSYKDHVYVVMLPNRVGGYIAVSLYSLNISPENLDYLDQIADSFFFIQ